MELKIKEARKNAGFSQKEVAITLHVSAPTVSEWESGRKTPTVENLCLLAELFHVSVDALLGRTKAATVSPVINLSEKKLVDSYRKAPPEIRAIVDTALAPYSPQNEKSDNEAM